MSDKIVVLGGSFNPPTIAHFDLMRTALDELNADKGIFVPVSHAYLKRKMVRSDSSLCLSEELRYQMLESMCNDDHRMSVSKLEYGLANGRTYDTLTEIQKQYPEAQLYFLLGSDKWDLIHDFSIKSDYFNHFYLAVVSRECMNTKEMVLNDPVLSPYIDRFAFLSSKEKYISVSSTAVRKSMEQGRDYSMLLHPVVYEQMRTIKLDDFPEEIVRFKGEDAFLDNMFPCQIEWERICYPCVEAAFQASKTSDMKIRQSFAVCRLDRIKEKGNRIYCSADWEDKKIAIMKQLLKIKFQSHAELAKLLKETEGKVLINGNNGKDSFWGTSLYSWDGENRLGQLLMEVRDEL